MDRRLIVALGCAMIAASAVATPVAAQTGVLSGVIYDQTNRAGLVGVEVRITGTGLVATTGKDGAFTIAGVPAGTREIEAARSGYRPFRLPLVKIVAADTAHVYLALSAIPEERIADATSAASGDDEVRVGSIVLKGSKLTSIGEISANAPLYMIDGIMLAPGTRVSELDPTTIESIEVIKGAAAESLYGSRGANGVIRIRTKRIPK